MAQGKVLLEEPLYPGFSAVVEANGFIFMSSVDGEISPGDGKLDVESFGDGPRQAANAYGELVKRLQLCGCEGANFVRVEHATSSQEWRLERMALWPQYFGVPTTAVSQGYQGRMGRQNMITVTAIAALPSLNVEVISPGPNPGRASRVTTCGDFTFVIGVRGERSLASDERTDDGRPEFFLDHVDFSYQNIEFHLAAAGLSKQCLVRMDSFIRSNFQGKEYRDWHRAFFEPENSPALNAVACSLGGRTDIEISAIGLRSGSAEVFYESGTLRQLPSAVKAGGFVFTSTMRSEAGMSLESALPLASSLDAEVESSIFEMQKILESTRCGLEDIVRLDVYVCDPYEIDDVRIALKRFFKQSVPPLVWHSVDLPTGVRVDISAIALE
jgi:enamine deaminase RidA (YjgF/YER057c/UK114 family)